MKWYKNTRIWTPAFYLWLLALLVLTSISFSPEMKKQNEGGFRFDYLEHFILYAAIPVLYFLADGASLKKIIKDNYYIILLGILFSVLTEIYQYFIPGRSFNPIDLMLNLGGFIAGILISKFILFPYSDIK